MKTISPLRKTIRRFRLRRPRVVALVLMLAMLLPISAPIPAWAYDLNLPAPFVDNDIALTSGNRSGKSLVDIAGGFSNIFTSLVSSSAIDRKSTDAPDRETLGALSKKVVGIKTQLPDELTLRVGESLALSALPLDKKGGVVNGIGSRWSSSDNEVLKIHDASAQARREGVIKLAVTAGDASETFNVRIVGRTESSVTLRRQRLAVPPDDEDEHRSSFTAENNLGSPLGQVEAQAPNSAAAFGGRRLLERPGSANFNFDVPVASLPGRGIDAGIKLSYNSRLWNFWQNPIAPQLSRYRYNMDGDWLAPGFKMTFGSLNLLNKTLISPDGTRHQIFFVSSEGYNRTHETADGTFIRIQTTVTSQNYITNTAFVRYPDGSAVTFTSPNNGEHHTFFLPTKITDRNGNTIHIAYREGDTKGRIWYVRDTLNRYINFHYDSTNRLVAVTVPGYDGAPARQNIRFYYETINFDTTTNRFQNANHYVPASADVLRYVYYPGTNTGYRYDYSPAWGMIYRILNLRGMQISEDLTNPASLTQTGTVTIDGQTAATTEFNYPLTLGTPLADVPRYTTRTDDWAGRTTPQPSVTTYQVEKDTTNGRTISKITSPDGTITETWAKIDENSWDDGLVTDTFTKTIVNPPMQVERTWVRSKLHWSNQPGTNGRQNPRMTKIENTNDADQTRATTFEYDAYNNQTSVKEHDFAAPGQLGSELRRTDIVYVTAPGWINNRMISLPSLVSTTVNGTVVSKTAYEYDNNGGAASANLTPRTDIDPLTHDARFNWSNGGIYDPATDYRGNVTRVTAFADATLSSDPNAVISTTKYDIAGNAVEAGVPCCKEKEWIYLKSNEYAYPMTEKKGDVGQLITSATYDRNTGLMRTSSDENGQVTTATYDPTNLRLTRIDRPNGAWTTTEYNDSAFPYHVKTTSSLDTNRSVSSWSFANGRGQTFRSRTPSTGGYLSSDVEFDTMGRGIRSYNPYTVAGLTEDRPPGIKFTEVTTRDGLGRTLVTTLPDSTTVTAAYSGVYATATDQAGKSRRQKTDALGRTVRVDEPIANPPSGNALGPVDTPHQPTHYEFDGNDNLTKVMQSIPGGVTQERIFRYDSLSRLTHERQVEAVPTLDSDGNKGESDPSKWTGFYKHTPDGLLDYSVDARGVKTDFTYDGLNRVKEVEYFGEVGYATPKIIYTYDEAEAGFFNNARLTRLQTVAVTEQTFPTEQNYDYDSVGQVKKHIQTINGQAYQLDYEYNLAGQLISEKYPSGKIVSHTVDNFGVVQTVADAQRTYVNGVTFSYAATGMTSQITLGNGTTETFTMNERFQMTSQSLSRGSEVLQKYDYSYGEVNAATGEVLPTKNNGQLGKIEAWIGANKQWSQRFGYDELGRLSEAREYKQGDNAQLTYKQKFDFDRFGNLYRKAASNATTGQQNPLPFTPIEETDINKSTNRFATATTYDEAGQVTTENKFRSMGFSYDANGRNVKVTRAGVPDAHTVYDALGNRVATKVNDVWQYVIYDAFGKLVAEYGVPDEGLGGVKYIQQDWQGSVRTVTNSNGFVVSRTDHQAFGETIGAGTGLRSVNQGYGVESSTRQGYGLTERDDATGLNHTWFRKNENRGGRWTGPDPYNGSMDIGEPQSFNRFSYVGNDPANFVDPSGLYRLGHWDGWWSGEFLWFFMESFTRSTDSRGGGGGGGAGGGNKQPNQDGCTGMVVSARANGNAVVLRFSDGSEETRTGGTRSWRNNNPGNVRSDRTQVGTAGGFAIFGTVVNGEAAKFNLLRSPSYQSRTVKGNNVDMTMGDAIARWAPPSENNTTRYQNFVAQKTGLSLQTPMSQLSTEDVASMANAMKTYEGYRAGTTSCSR